MRGSAENNYDKTLQNIKSFMNKRKHKFPCQLLNSDNGFMCLVEENRTMVL